MIIHTIYEPATGRIVATGRCEHDPTDHYRALGFGVVLEPSDRTTQYVDITVDPPALRPRPVLDGFARTTLAVGEGVTMAVPAGATVTVNGAETVIDDGVLDLIAEHPMVHRVTVEAWPYRTYEVEVTCVFV